MYKKTQIKIKVEKQKHADGYYSGYIDLKSFG